MMSVQQCHEGDMDAIFENSTINGTSVEKCRDFQALTVTVPVKVCLVAQGYDRLSPIYYLKDLKK